MGIEQQFNRSAEMPNIRDAGRVPEGLESPPYAAFQIAFLAANRAALEADASVPNGDLEKDMADEYAPVKDENKWKDLGLALIPSAIGANRLKKH